MELKHLRTFVMAGRLLNFTRVAEAAGMTQVNVTFHIQRIERVLGERVFERLGKKLALTPAGRLFLSFAERAVAMVDEGVDAVGYSHRKVIVGAAESMCAYRLPAILKEYRAAFPEVELYVRTLDCDEYFSSLATNAVDVVFALGEGAALAGALCIAESDEPIAAFACPGHPLSRRRRVRAADFADQPTLLTGEGCCYRGMFLRLLESEGVCPKIIMETNSVQVLKQAAVHGLGVCVLPEMAVADEVRDGGLVRLPFTALRKGIVSRILIHRDKWLSPPLSGMFEIAAPHFARTSKRCHS